MDGLVGLLPLVAIALLFWLLIIRPASRRQKDQVRMQNSLDVGNQVMLTSGIFGTVTAMTESRLNVEVAPGVTLEVARGAIGSVVPPDEPESDLDGAEGADTAESAAAEQTADADETARDN